jgi:hypothetical protein
MLLLLLLRELVVTIIEEECGRVFDIQLIYRFML